LAIETVDLRFFYGPTEALKNIDIQIPRHQVTAFIGPSGCGKSTLLRCFNRMNDLIEGSRVVGKVLVDEQDIYQTDVKLEELRQQVGMVFQKSNPFPMSIQEISGPGCAASRAAAVWTRSSRTRCGAPTCGVRSRTG
jgi:phosphate transport system ATP-binding protein